MHSVAIIGGGYIGIEIAENIKKQNENIKLTVIEKADH